MDQLKIILNKRFAEYAYPYKNAWWRLYLHSGIALVAPLYFLFTGSVELYLKIALITFSNDIAQGWVHVYAYHRLENRFDWIEEPWKRSLWGVFWHFIITIVLYFAVNLIAQRILFGHPFENTFPYLVHFLYVPVILITLVMIFSTANEFWKKWKRSLVNEQKARAEMMAYKYDSLKNQINPHFLFNSFNVLVNLVDQDQQLAKEFIIKLSQLYRNVLEGGENELIPLKDELEFISSYIFLLKIRFEDKLIVAIDLPFEEDEMVVPMVLQTLIENAVKHNTASKKEPLMIKVHRDHEYLIVSNNLNVIKITGVTSKTGLKNVKQRYTFFTNKKIEIGQSVNEFEVKIPILKAQ